MKLDFAINYRSAKRQVTIPHQCHRAGIAGDVKDNRIPRLGDAKLQPIAVADQPVTSSRPQSIRSWIGRDVLFMTTLCGEPERMMINRSFDASGVEWPFADARA